MATKTVVPMWRVLAWRKEQEKDALEAFEVPDIFDSIEKTLATAGYRRTVLDDGRVRFEDMQD